MKIIIMALIIGFGLINNNAAGAATNFYKVTSDITEKNKLLEKEVAIDITIIHIMTVMVLLLCICIILLIISLKKLKKQKLKISNLNELRKTFINAGEGMIYLKDQNFKYVFVNMGLEKSYEKPSSEIVSYDDYKITDSELAAFIRQTDIDVLEKMDTIIDTVCWRNKVYETTKFPVKLPDGNYGVGAYVKEITEEYNNKKSLEEKNKLLLEKEANLKLILDSTAEAIYGTDLEGRCTFCNNSCLRILGFNDQSELLGKQIHGLIHHTRRDGTQIPIKECEIMRAITEKKGIHGDNEVFFRADKTCFDAEYYAYPKFCEGRVTGAVVTFLDITEKKKAENELIYLSYHDVLTELYNQRYIYEELKNIDIKGNLPISVIIADVNGLKQMNDIFGHDTGDKLIKKAAEVMKRVCRKNDIIVRSGGDEFLIILPKTAYREVKRISNDIKLQFSKEHIGAFTCSISIGCETKISCETDIDQIIKKAESDMYLQKTLERKKYSTDFMRDIEKAFRENHPLEKRHADNVSYLCLSMGKRLKLSKSELRRLKDAGYYHDIGKISLERELLNKEDALNNQEMMKMKEHSITGFRILNSSDSTLDIAKYVLSHHERWDGKGYPHGLKGEIIPRISRIIALAESYDSMMNDVRYKEGMTKNEAILELKKNAGTKFDPYLTEVFIGMLMDAEDSVEQH